MRPLVRRYVSVDLALFSRQIFKTSMENQIKGSSKNE
jgi:hypothetical protein